MATEMFSTKVPDNSSKSFEFPVPEHFLSIEKAVQKYGKEKVQQHLKASLIVSLQGSMRRAFKKADAGEPTKPALQKIINEWEPGAGRTTLSAAERLAKAMSTKAAPMTVEEAQRILDKAKVSK